MQHRLMALDMAPPVKSIESYMQWVQKVPLLSKDEEEHLAILFRDQADLSAARKLVLSQLRYVVYVAKGYLGYGLPLADLIQEGNIGLMKAVKRYDPAHQVRLVAFAVHWIKAEIHDFIIRNWRIVKVATTKAQRKLFFNLRKLKSKLTWWNDDEIAWVANDLGVKEADVREMESRLSSSDISFDLSPGDSEEVTAFVPADYLEDNRYNPEFLLSQVETQEHLKVNLREALLRLDPRSQEILEARWMREEKHKLTLHDLAKKYGVSPERIRQIEQKALEKLKEAVS